jgi:hypothetical protein
MIKVLTASYLDDYRVAVQFSDGKEGVFDGKRLLSRTGPLLEPLREESYFQRVFVDAGALCWPNGLELSPAYVHENAVELAAV